MKKNISFALIFLFVTICMLAKSIAGKDSDNHVTDKITDTGSMNHQNMETMDNQITDYLALFHHEDGSIALTFNIEDDRIFALGEEMNALREEAYMNGYNWDAFLNYYLAVNAPDILEGMETDPEAGGYVAYYENGVENEAKAKRLADIIVSLIENKEEIFRILRENGDEIEWD